MPLGHKRKRQQNNTYGLHPFVEATVITKMKNMKNIW